MNEDQEKGLRILNSCRFNLLNPIDVICYYKNVVIEDYRKYLNVSILVKNLYYMNNKFFWEQKPINNEISLNLLLDTIKTLNNDTNLYFQGITNDLDNNYYVRIGR